VDAQFAHLLRQLVAEGDLGPRPGGPADRRPGEAAAEGPELGPAAGQDHLLGEADRQLDPGRGQLRRDRQRGAKRHRRLGGGAVEPGERPAEAAARGQGREHAATEDAEEGSAPQARR
jgi:hypothetical protein